VHCETQAPNGAQAPVQLDAEAHTAAFDVHGSALIAQPLSGALHTAVDPLLERHSSVVAGLHPPANVHAASEPHAAALALLAAVLHAPPSVVQAGPGAQPGFPSHVASVVYTPHVVGGLHVDVPGSQVQPHCALATVVQEI
jgi:hypothetical protein